MLATGLGHVDVRFHVAATQRRWRASLRGTPARLLLIASMYEQLRHTVGPGHRAAAACSESCSSRSEWETEDEGAGTTGGLVQRLQGAGSAVSPVTAPCGGPVHAHPPREQLLELERSFTEDTRRLHERFYSAQDWGDALAHDGSSTLAGEHTIDADLRMDEASDDELGGTLPTRADDGDAALLDAPATVRVREATPSPELASNSEWTGAVPVGVPGTDSPEPPLPGLLGANFEDATRANGLAGSGTEAALSAVLPGAQVPAVVPAMAPAMAPAVAPAVAPAEAGEGFPHSLTASCYSNASAASAPLSVAGDSGLSPTLIQSVTIPLCPVGDEARLRAQLSRSRAQLHAAQLELKRTAGELSTTQQRLEQQVPRVRTVTFGYMRAAGAAARAPLVLCGGLCGLRGGAVMAARGRVASVVSARERAARTTPTAH